MPSIPRLRAAWAVLPLVALVACGGGGGGGGTDGPSAVLTSTNADAAGHAAAAAFLALGGTGELALNDGLAAGPGASTLGATGAEARAPRGWLPRVRAVLAAPLTGRSVAAASPRRRALAVIGPETAPCEVDGSVSATLEDFDNDGVLGLGDRLTLDFDACRDSADETVDGSVSIRIVALSSSTATAELVLAALAVTSPSEALTLSGELRLDITLSGSGDTVERTVLTAVGDVALGVSTALPFSDSVTLLDGWRLVQQFDETTPPLPGNVLGGLTTTTASGRLASAAVGGTMDVTTPSALAAYGEDPYPRAGTLRVTGRTGAVQLTALSVDQVRLELDANDDGVWESSRVVDWDWLL